MTVICCVGMRMNRIPERIVLYIISTKSRGETPIVFFLLSEIHSNEVFLENISEIKKLVIFLQNELEVKAL